MTIRPRRIGMLAGIVGLVVVAPAAEASRSACSRGRDCHPPARLWYRVSASLKAEQKVNGDVPPSSQSTGHEERYDWAQEWELERKHAVRVTLMCANLAPPQQFIDTATPDQGLR